ncbi:MAG TPA: ABC transporter permease [Tissierellia bacterium]|nr:ABC transporter permease [Tissierellia bacterium]
MSVVRRAWLSITRRTGKSLLLFFIVLILGNAIAGAIAVQQAATNVERKIKQELGAAVVMSIDNDKLHAMFQEYADHPEEMPSIAAPSLDVIRSIGNSRYVKYYDYSTSIVTGSSQLEEYVPPFLLETRVGFSGNALEKYYAFTLRGVHYHKVLAIEEGKLNLTSGRVFTEEEIKNGEAVAIISQSLAEQNGIQVNDTVVLTHYVFDQHHMDPTTGTLTLIDHIDNPVKVIGIVTSQTCSEAKTQESAKSEVEKHQQAWVEKETANTIYMPNGYIIDLNQDIFRRSAEANPELYGGVERSEEQTWYETVYVLKDPDDMERFKEENAPFLPDMFTLVTASDDYKEIAAPVEQMKKIAGYVLSASVGASVLIVTLVVLLFLRERKHELGVYLSLGEKRANVVKQILTEVLMITLIGLVLSVFTGMMIASSLSQAMVSTQLEKETEGPVVIHYGGSSSETFLQNDITAEDVVNAYTIRLSPAYILVYFLVSMGAVAVSTLLPVLYILRLRPRNILMSA